MDTSPIRHDESIWEGYASIEQWFRHSVYPDVASESEEERKFAWDCCVGTTPYPKYILGDPEPSRIRDYEGACYAPYEEG